MARLLRMGLGLLILVTATGPVFGQGTVTLGPEKDNTLYYGPTPISNGLGNYLFIGNNDTALSIDMRRALVQWDVSGAVPAGSVIDSAELSLVVSREKIAVPRRIMIHKVMAEWGEGTSNATGNEGQGAAAVAPDATWLNRMHPATPWVSIGGDFVTPASDSMQLATASAVPNVHRLGTAAVNDIQSWLDIPGQNYGWILIGDETQIRTVKRVNSGNFGVASQHPRLTIWYTAPTAVSESGDVRPESAFLHQNVPNPFNPSTRIDYTLPRSAQVKLVIYDLTGRLVKTLVERVQSAGEHSASWDGTNSAGQPVASGVYFYALSSDGVSTTKKMVLIR